MTLPRRVSILGSTGSIGVSTLDLLERSGAQVEVVALTAGRNVARLAEQALHWRPSVAVIEDPSLLDELKARLAGSGVEVACGAGAVEDVARREADWVMSAIVGFAGLAPTLAAARTGAIVALANKESLVCAGPSLLRIAKLAGGAVVPVDSEHSAIFQVFERANADRISRLILTASGGPFRTWSGEQMALATPEQALAHPNWSMGAKISVDSATMMNKGLEVIEAHWLFGAPPEQIEVVIHPQSVIHSMVAYADGSVLAQLGNPDMRTPIAHALAYPERIDSGVAAIDLARIAQLDFRQPDFDRFPCLKLAFDALKAGGSAATVLNAANEVAVEAFLERRIGFRRIPELIADVLDSLPSVAIDGLESLLEQDRAARVRAHALMNA